MRVLYVNHTALVSGAEHSLLTLLCAIDGELVAELACPEGELAQRAREAGVRVHPIAGASGSFRLHPRGTVVAAGEIARMGAELSRIASATGADLIHANSVRAGLGAGLSRRQCSRPLVVHVRDCLPDGPAGMMVRRAVAARADAVVAISNYVAESFAGAHRARRALPTALHVVDNPVDLDRFSATTSPGAPAPADPREAGRRRPPTLAIIGQITEWKGHETAIRALAAVRPRFPDARLLVVGEVKFAVPSTRLDNRAYLGSLHALVQQLGLAGAVELTGERRDVPEIMRSCTAVLVPSIEEPFGRTVAEAMAIGTPVIATTIGGPPELIEHGKSGTLAPPGDPDAWARAILSVLEDPDRAAKMAERARREAARRFDPHTHVAALLEIYETLTRGGEQRPQQERATHPGPA